MAPQTSQLSPYWSGALQLGQVPLTYRSARNMFCWGSKDWTIVPSQFYPWSMHPPALARVFETTYETLGRVEMEPHATPCCSLVPKCPRLLGRLWRRHTVVSGRRVDALEDVFERLDLGEVKLEDIFHLLPVEGRPGTLLGTRAPTIPRTHA